MIALASPVDPPDRFDLVVDQDAEPADFDRLLDALDRMVERRLSQRTQNETGGPGPATRSDHPRGPSEQQTTEAQPS